MTEVKKIAVIGSGAMGRQIGMAAAVAGYGAVVQDISAEAIQAAEQDMAKWVEGRVAKGRMTREEVDAAWSRLAFTTDTAAAVGSADLVIEAATERLDIKRQIFAQIDQFAPPHAILATNSSTYGSSSVADATTRPEKVCNMHFFNPALVMKAVEVVRNPETSDDTVDSIIAVIERMGKHPVVLNKEIPGFIANRLMGAVRAEALNLLEQGVASIEDIDTAAKSALGYPMGPFELMDLVGLDVTYLIRQATFEVTGEESEAPHPLLTEKYEAGDFGRKSGKGWYVYA